MSPTITSIIVTPGEQSSHYEQQKQQEFLKNGEGLLILSKQLLGSDRYVNNNDNSNTNIENTKIIRTRKQVLAE